MRLLYVLLVMLNENFEGHKDMTYFCKGECHDLLRKCYRLIRVIFMDLWGNM